MSGRADRRDPGFSYRLDIALGRLPENAVVLAIELAPALVSDFVCRAGSAYAIYVHPAPMPSMCTPNEGLFLANYKKLHSPKTSQPFQKC